MKFIDEYRDAKAARRYANLISRVTTKPWTIMEVCGGQTHAIVKFGVGEIPQSGLGLRDKYMEHDAELRFGVAGHTVEESSECMSGLILQGQKKPHECPAFGTRCTPEHPFGATMVSSEGACAAYCRYRRVRT